MVKNQPANAGDTGDVESLGQEDPLEEGMATHTVFLPGKSHGQRSLVGYTPWGLKESDMTEVTWHAHMHTFLWLGPTQLSEESL